MIFSAWGADGEPNTLIAGEGPPRFGDGRPDPTAPDRIWRFEADTWEEAERRYHQLQGWES
jgi:hypothetical protein